MAEAKKMMALVAMLCCVTCRLVQGFAPVTVTTSTVIADQTPEDVQEFLASPGNWPKIVSTSFGVASEEDVSKPLPVGKTVDEVFGLPPILPLSVTWTCTKSTPPFTPQKSKLGGLTDNRCSAGRLEFFSSKGLEGVASNCEMIFDVRGRQQQSTGLATEVVLNMKYDPQSFLAILAIPILTIDNAVALQFLLPAAMRTSPELDKFRNLMGTLYLGAGLAHLLDCLFGGSQLLTMAGSPPFEMLPLIGQVYALLWCIMGPTSFGLSKLGAGFADIGLILYGLVEVGGALLIEVNHAGVATSHLNPVINSILVQSVVAASWFYSANKTPEEAN